jgi:2-polyprenyl-6-methoxyphenol hydroxylase-like FAD-dependent oxidoreductase
MADFDVVVAGAGLGGLCAAAGLRGTGRRVVVLERDERLDSRRQGYRININRAGHTALRACLPDTHFALYRETSHRQVDASVDLFSTDLRRLHHRMGDTAGMEPPPAAVDRGILRAILLDAAGDVRFGCEVVAVASDANSAEVQLKDGSKIRAELVVAADGAMSTLRRCLLPGCDPTPLGVTGIYGRTLLDTNALTWLPRGVLDQRFVGVTDGAGLTLALGAWHPRRTPTDAAGEYVPHLNLPNVTPYVMWVLLGPDRALPGPQASARELQQAAVAAISGWHPAATCFVRDAILADTFRITLRAAQAVPAWLAGRVTFLGDAIHAMSPAGGEGANTALADAASLAACLGEEGLGGLEAYERDLRERAQDALTRSARYGESRKSMRKDTKDLAEPLPSKAHIIISALGDYIIDLLLPLAIFGMLASTGLSAVIRLTIGGFFVAAKACAGRLAAGNDKAHRVTFGRSLLIGCLIAASATAATIAAVRWGYSETLAIGVGTTVLAVVQGIDLVRTRRRLDGFALLVLVELAATIALTSLSSNLRFVMIRPSFYTAIAGFYVLSTVPSARPFMMQVSKPMAAGGDPVRAEAFERAGRESVSFRRTEQAMTIGLGVLLLAEAVLRVFVVMAHPPSHVVESSLWSQVPGVALFVIYFAVVRLVFVPRASKEVDRFMAVERTPQ